MTFLPYHTTPLFPTMLSILPQTIPPLLKFLHPYIRSLANPPRHTLVYTASNSRVFLTALSKYVLKACRQGHQHQSLICLWASITTEATAAMLDRLRSTKLEFQRQNQDDIMLSLLPVLNEGFTLTDVPEFRIGCYMVVIILASKADLDDDIVVGMMEAITSGWEQTLHAGVICLAVLAQQMHNVKLSRQVVKRISDLERLDDHLLLLKEQYKLDSLVLGLVVGIIDGLSQARDAGVIVFLRALIDRNFMDAPNTAVAVKILLIAAQTTSSEANSIFDVKESLTDLICCLADSKTIGTLVQSIIKDSKLDMSYLRATPKSHGLICNEEIAPHRATGDIEQHEAKRYRNTADFDFPTNPFPARTPYEISFLSSSSSYMYGSLEHAFLTIPSSPNNFERFSNLPVLQKSFAMTEALFLTFFVRVWCGKNPPDRQVAAIQIVSRHLSQELVTADVQILLPYIIYALADPSLDVRRAITDLVLILASIYLRVNQEDSQFSKAQTLGQHQVYGQGRETEGVSWLSMSECAQFISDLIVPGLEECQLDEGYVLLLLSESLGGLKHSKFPKLIRKEIKTSLRLAIFKCLCSHVVSTPLYAVKFRLLKMLNRVTKIGDTSRTKLLSPLLSDFMTKNQPWYENVCEKERIDQPQLIARIIDIVDPVDKDGIQSLKTIIKPTTLSEFPSLLDAGLKHIRFIWPSINHDSQLSLAKMLLELAITNPDDGLIEPQKMQALETLMSLPLATTILQFFIEHLPSISCSLLPEQAASEHRQLYQNSSAGASVINTTDISRVVKEITLVLEVIEDNQAERHPELLKGLFQVMADLQYSQEQSDTATGYLQVLTMDSILAILRRLEVGRIPCIILVLTGILTLHRPHQI